MAPRNKDGAKMPPDPPEPMVMDVAASLATSSRPSAIEREVTGQRLVDGFVADAEDLRERDADHSDTEPAQTRLEVVRNRNRVEEILRRCHRANESQGDEPGGDTHYGVGDQLEGAHQMVGGHLEGRLVAEKQARDHRGYDGRDHDRTELGHGEIADDDFDGEERTGDGGIEGGRDSRSGSAPDHGAQLLRRHLEQLAEPGGDG